MFGSAVGFDIMHVVRLCYMAEILKTGIGIRNAGGFERFLAEWERAGKLGAVRANINMGYAGQAPRIPSRCHTRQYLNWWDCHCGMTLVDEAMRRRCPNSGKELADPSVCLLCGEMFLLVGRVLCELGERGL